MIGVPGLVTDKRCLDFHPDWAFSATGRLLRGIKGNFDRPLEQSHFAVMPFYQACHGKNEPDVAQRLSEGAMKLLNTIPHKINLIWITIFDYGRCMKWVWGVS